MSESIAHELKISRANLLDRTMHNLREAWRDMADWSEGLFAAPNPNLPEKDMEALKEQMHDCLMARGGEVSARARAANLGRIYLSLNAQGRKKFLQILAQEFDIDRKAVNKAAAALQKAEEDNDERAKAERTLRQALQPPRLRLLTQLNALPEGFHFLVDLRAELLSWRKDDPSLAALERDLLSLLASWFDVGFLELRRISWESPATLLEKVIAYEAVHPIKSWDDLKNRLSADRRCFAFFHPRMANEPLIIVQVALVHGISDNVQTLLDESAPIIDSTEADTAIFYSISNAHEGLSGISFGNFLIKRVVDELANEFKNLKTFATLSPIPGFRRWLDDQLRAPDADAESELLSASELKILATAANLGNEPVTLSTLLQIPEWHQNPELCKALKKPLMRLCARYLAKEKREGGTAFDRVAHFHLSNGARIERLNWLGNTSALGTTQSAGLMVNYLYKLNDIEANHEAYRGEGKVTSSSAIRSLLKG